MPVQVHRDQVPVMLDNLAIALVVLYGIYLRVQLYLSNRSLWLDTARLANNIIERSYHGLFQPLDYGQSAPFGFLVAVKALASCFKYSELALILIPFLAGVGSLILFAVLCYRLLGSKKAFLPVACFSLCSTAIYYSAELKQYSTDLFVSTMMLLLGVLTVQSRYSARSMIWLFGAGVIAVWFSHPSIFVLAGVALGLFAGVLADSEQKRKKWLPILIGGILWLVNYALIYFLVYRPSISAWLAEYHAIWLAPFPITTREQIHWYYNTFRGLFDYPLGFDGHFIVPSLLLLAGLVTVLTSRSRRGIYAIILLPLVMLYIGSAAGKYPIATGNYDIYSRLILFTIPIFFVIMGEGIWTLAAGYRVAAIALILVTILPMVRQHVYMRQETRPLVEYIYLHRLPADTIYVYSSSTPAFHYYNRRYQMPYVSGDFSTTKEQQLQQIDQLVGKGRIWFLFSHSYGYEKLFRDRLDRMGHLVEQRMEPGASLYLYEL